MELVNAYEDGDAGKCRHFSIRGYVAEVRKKDIKICWPFANVDSSNNLQEQGHNLPPLNVIGFRWWGCQNCLKFGLTNGAAETGEPVNHCNESHAPFSHSHENAAVSSHGDTQDGLEPMCHTQDNVAISFHGVAQDDHERITHSQENASISSHVDPQDGLETIDHSQENTAISPHVDPKDGVEPISHFPKDTPVSYKEDAQDGHESITHFQENAAVLSHVDPHDGLEPILHSQENAAISFHGNAQNGLEPIIRFQENASISSHGNAQDGHEPISHSQDNAVISSHVEPQDGVEPVGHYQEKTAILCHGDTQNSPEAISYFQENAVIPSHEDAQKGLDPISLSLENAAIPSHVDARKGLEPISLSLENAAISSHVDPLDGLEPISHSLENSSTSSYENTQVVLEAISLSQENSAISSHGDRPDGLQPISHSQQTAYISSHGDAHDVPEPISNSQENAPISSNGLEFIHREDDPILSDGAASLQFSGLPQASKETISEERNDNTCAIKNVNEEYYGNLSLSNHMEEVEAAIVQPTGEDQCPNEGLAGNVTNDEPCLAEGTSNGFNGTTISFNSDVHRYNAPFHKTDASDKPTSRDEFALEKFSLEKHGEKGKLKRMTTSFENYLGENLGVNQKDVFKIKKRKKGTSDCPTSLLNNDIDESDEEFFGNGCNSSGGTVRRRKVRRVRTLKEILSSPAAVLVSPGDLNTDRNNSEAANSNGVRKAILGIDLNLYPDSVVAAQGNGENVSLSKKGKGRIFQDEDEGYFHENDELFGVSKKKDKLSRVDGKSAFFPWKEGSGIQITSDEAQDTMLRLGGEGHFTHGGGSQFHQPEASSFPKVSANGIFEPAASEEMEVIALLAKSRHEKRLLYAEGAKGNSSDRYICQPSVGFPTLSLSPPSYMPFGTNNHQRLGCGSSNVNTLSEPLELPSELLMRRARECEYRQKPVEQLLANDIIPATDLLRLMDAGAGASTSTNVNQRQMFTDQSLLPHEHNLKQLARRDFGQPKNGGSSSHPPSWGFFDKSPGVQSFGYYSQERDSGLPKLMSDAFKSQAKETPKRKKAGPQPFRKSRLENCVSRNAISGEWFEIGETFLSLSIPMVSPTESQATASSIHAGFDLNQTDGTEICTVNRNPADFSVPGRGNEYMIGYRELKHKKTASTGDKRKRMGKLMRGLNFVKAPFTG